MARNRSLEEWQEIGTASYDSGLALEIEFGEYMIKELGWEKFKIRRAVTRGKNYGAKNVDILAKRPNQFGLKMKEWARLYFISCISLILMAVICSIILQEKFFLVAYLIASFIPLTLGLIAYPLGKVYLVEHARVECKGGKEGSDIDLIHVFNGDHGLYLKSGDKEYTFKELYYVSAHGFAENALRLAIDSKIKCYIKEKSGNFVQIDLWD